MLYACGSEYVYVTCTTVIKRNWDAIIVCSRIFESTVILKNFKKFAYSILVRYRARCNDNVFLGRRNEQMEDLHVKRK